MFNFLREKIKTNNIDTSNQVLKIINTLKEEFSRYNPFEKYVGAKYEYHSRDKISFHLECDVKKIKKESKLSSLKITDDWSSIKKCAVEVSLKEYNEVYGFNKKDTTVYNLLKDIENSYSKMNTEKQNLFNDACLHTFNIIKEAISVTVPDDEMKDVYIELLTLCLEELNEINKETRNNALDNLKMEIEYLNKIKETRKTFDIVNDKMSIT